jgi:hypothetical protein
MSHPIYITKVETAIFQLKKRITEMAQLGVETKFKTVVGDYASLHTATDIALSIAFELIADHFRWFPTPIHAGGFPSSQLLHGLFAAAAKELKSALEIRGTIDRKEEVPTP